MRSWQTLKPRAHQLHWLHSLTVSCPATPKSATKSKKKNKTVNFRYLKERECCGLTELCVSLQVEQDVACLDVSVDFPLKVQVFKSPQCILQHNGYLLFSELCGGEVHSLELLQRTMRIKLQTPLPPFLPPAANQQKKCL